MSLLFGWIFLLSMKAFANENEQWFTNNYDQARKHFLEVIQNVPDEVAIKHIQTWQVQSNKNDQLYVDFVHLKSTKNLMDRKPLTILISGTHGVEAAVGSTLQRYFIKNYILDELNKGHDFLIIHSLNPFGFKFHRRVTENNVDLNRNFSFDKNLYQQKNEKYSLLNLFLNPNKAADHGFLDQYSFYFEAFKWLLRYPTSVLRQAILQGQYAYPKGLYFGGQYPEPQYDFILSSILTKTKDATHIFIVDIHTGYGQRGMLHLLSDETDLERKKKLSELFLQNIDYGQNKDFYVVSGGLIDFIEDHLKKSSEYKFLKFGQGVVFEFGTKDSQTTKGSLDSLYIMIRENQSYHYGGATKKSQDWWTQEILEMYNPEDKIWRQNTLEQFNKTLLYSLDQLLKM